MNFKMIRQARNRNNVCQIVALHSNIFAGHKIRETYWNMLMTEVGNTISKRRLEYYADKLRHRQTIADSSVLQVI